MECKICGGKMIEKRMLWYGNVSVRWKCTECGFTA